MSTDQKQEKRRIGFFVHHQGSGHARRCCAIIRELRNCEVTVFSASDEHFSDLPDGVEFRLLPNMIGAEARVDLARAQVTPGILHCAPLGVSEARTCFGMIAEWMRCEDPHLLFVDVSAELAILARIMSVPCVKVRMHGSRGDAGHSAAYESCAGLYAPFHPELEQPDYPVSLRKKTFYSGGLCTTTSPVLSREEARGKLGLPQDRRIIVVVSGAGGRGSPYAPLTVGARAEPETEWIVLGPVVKEGHETDFPNLRLAGWVDTTQDYISAADIVIASGGDNTVTEIARAGRRFLCIPEWRYFDEQVEKARMFADFGAAVTAEHWPGTIAGWQHLLEEVDHLNPERQELLFDENAATKSARYLMDLIDELWGNSKNTNQKNG